MQIWENWRVESVCQGHQGRQLGRSSIFYASTGARSAIANPWRLSCWWCEIWWDWRNRRLSIACWRSIGWWNGEARGGAIGEPGCRAKLELHNEYRTGALENKNDVQFPIFPFAIERHFDALDKLAEVKSAFRLGQIEPKLRDRDGDRRFS